jgi:O-antigen ligase
MSNFSHKNEHSGKVHSVKQLGAKFSDHLLVLPLGLVLVDLAFQKNFQDPLNPIKLSALGLVAIWAFANLVTSRQLLRVIAQEKAIKVFGIILGIFIISFFIAFLLTPVKSVALLGDSGRNLGFLNYLFLGIISAYAASRLSLNNIKNIYMTVFILNFILTLYGFLQHFKIDFLRWNNQNNAVILMTGNPDFASSLLGLFSVLCLAGLLIDFNRMMKIMIGILTVVTVIVIYWTQARQGLIATVAGFGFITFVFIWQKSKKTAISLLVCEIAVGVFSVLGMLQIGPLTKYFFKASITDRGYNWRAAVGMFKSHPLFGVGVDRYGSFFMQYRSPKYPLLFGYTQTVNNAHNVFLELFATAGIFVGLAYIALLGYIAYRAFVALKSTSGTEQIIITGIVAAWIVFLAQSFISVDSIVISIWGWMLGGAIVGLSSLKRDVSQPVSRGILLGTSRKGRKRVESPISLYRGAIFTASFIALGVIILPIYQNETAVGKFINTLAPTDPAGKDRYRAVAHKTFHQPLLSPNYKAQIAAKMATENYGPEAISYFKQTIKSDSRNGDSYNFLARVYENLKSSTEAISYRKQLAKLDPYGAPNLLSLEIDYLLIGDRPAAIEIQKAILSMAPGTDVANQSAKILESKILPPKK